MHRFNRQLARFTLIKCLCLTVFGLASTAATAAWPWVEGTITDIRIINSGGDGDGVVVYGNFVPATGCTNNAFVLPKTDSYHTQIYAAMLLAKATNTPIRYLHAYCTSDGYSRGNEYIVTSN
jgi:hypothetical protein